MIRGLAIALSAALSALGVAACSSATSDLPAFEVERQDLEFSVMAEGELVASEALPITLPSDMRMQFNIVWLAPEFSAVRKGDVIARFDDVQVQLDREATALNVAKSDFELAGTERSGRLERTRIRHESDRVEGEREISEAFSAADERLFSRNELIDILADIEYLDAESTFLDWQFDTLDQRTQAEQNLILAERAGELSKLDDFMKALLEELGPELGEDTLLLLTSDHGNLEDLSVKTHTRNPVPFVARGPAASDFTDVRSILDVTPAILRSLGSED